jgi:hypothetical protein
VERFLLLGALLLAVAALGPIALYFRVWAQCAKRRHQEAMIYLAYKRELITKAEIDTMLKQVEEFDGSCLSVIEERKRAMTTAALQRSQGSPPDPFYPALRTGLIGGSMAHFRLASTAARLDSIRRLCPPSARLSFLCQG